MKTIQIKPEVLDVLRRSTVTETNLKLPAAPRLDPKLYKEVNKVIEPVPAGTFKESGTNIATVIIVIDKPAA